MATGAFTVPENTPCHRSGKACPRSEAHRQRIYPPSLVGCLGKEHDGSTSTLKVYHGTHKGKRLFVSLHQIHKFYSKYGDLPNSVSKKNFHIVLYFLNPCSIFLVTSLGNISMHEKSKSNCYK